jgi:hypothetical protein
MLISLMCLVTQSLGGSGPKRNLLLLGMQMLIINLVTHIICIPYHYARASFLQHSNGLHSLCSSEG